MQIYSNIFSLNRPTDGQFYVGPNSEFGIAVKVLSNDSPLTGAIYCGDLTADEDKIDGYTVFTTSSTRESKVYTISCAQAPGRTFKLQQTTTTSPVFQRGGASGGGGGDFDPTKYYKKTETSSATELQTAFGGVDLSVASLDTSVLTNTNGISAISAFTNEVGPILSGDGEQTFGLVGQVDNLTGDMSMLQSTVNDMYGDVQSLTSEVYNGDSTDRCAKVITDANCSADGMGSWTQGVTNIRQISQSDYDDLVNNMETDSHCLYIIAGSI